MATSENPISARNAVDQDASQNHRIAYALFRLTLGLNIFFHGFIRIVVGRQNFVAQTEKLFTNTFLPMWQVHLFLSILPFLEVLVGLFLILGLLTRWALVGGALLMMVLIFGTATRQDWNTVGTQTLYGLFYFFLISRMHDNCFALDRLLAKH
jgi:thiosulfate dehydrogenase (quinone) large subunit